MQLGAFSISLAVKDIRASEAFYSALGFVKFAGDIEQNWLILANGQSKIGLFQGMFEKNSLTFNPGWNQNGETLEGYEDIRQIQKTLKAKGIALTTEADENTSGPAHFALVDPDGNPVLVDQHV